jgi:hypothetical protein
LNVRAGFNKSVIDLAIASPSVAISCITYTESDCFGSDHFPVITLINRPVHRTSKFVYKLRLNPKKLKIFSQVCSQLSIAEAVNDASSALGSDLVFFS